MWLLIERIRVDKYHHMLFRDRKSAEEYLNSLGAKRKSQGVFLVKRESVIEGWKSTSYTKYTLEYLMIRETVEEVLEDEGI